ncbi:monofunctional riboflavin biosynthesis protein RIBA 3, chloroplastic-like [Momordica charantia]|uniref:GTP cyclohydrolase II n=1 Tax=Momordica charantia TaxID=3673 RepID=A0A6J1DY85_MOMCH|nr:monofunctional riboflavin biosynthesis protein RIBA 3, chloroplastic-like [Momordica charantia]
MDSALLCHPLFTRFNNLTLSTFNNRPSFAPPPPQTLRKSKQRTSNSASSAAAFSAGNMFDETPTTKNGKPSVAASTLGLGAETSSEAIDFFDNLEDPDHPSDGYSSIQSAVDAIHQGKFVIVVDDENGDSEGNLVMAASFATPGNVTSMVQHGSGIVYVGMKEDDLQRLKLPLFSVDNGNNETSTFTITVDVKTGTSGGVSAADRAKTIVALSSSESKPEDFRRPGHVFPVRYRDGGVLRRAGHTEASVDLVALAGLRPVSVLSAIVDTQDGSMASLPKLRSLASQHQIPMVSITDLIRYRRKRENLIERIAISRLPTKWGQFYAHCYRSKVDGIEHVALVKGNIGDGQDVLVRVHSECLTGDIFASARCDCGNQLDLAMQMIEKAGRGAVIYLRGHEGRGIGLGPKLLAYNLQDQGHDTVEANLELGLPADARDYGVGAQMLRDIGIRTMRLMTNNPAKFKGLKGYGLAVTGRVPVVTQITDENRKYLETKRTKMGHIYAKGPLSAIHRKTTPEAEAASN